MTTTVAQTRQNKKDVVFSRYMEILKDLGLYSAAQRTGLLNRFVKYGMIESQERDFAKDVRSGRLSDEQIDRIKSQLL